MEISAISATTPTAESAGTNSMSSEDFFQLLITEMQNQDPFKPSDTSTIIEQVSQIRSIEQTEALNGILDTFSQQQRLGGTTDLIGKYVQAIATDADGNEALFEGVVTSVFFNSDGSAVLELDTGQAIPAANVVRVVSLDQLEAALAGATIDDDSDDSAN